MLKPTIIYRAAALLLVTVWAAMPITVSAAETAQPRVMDGDVIFQISDSQQSRAIQLATQSEYSHCGIVFHKDGRPHVYEAVSGMLLTPLDAWIRGGIGGHYLLMRLKDRDRYLNAKTLAGMKKAGQQLAKKRYDILFQWSDDKIYCSELVWKIYERGAGITLAKPRPFREYTLDKPEVRALIKQRYGNAFPLDEKAVAPSDLAASPLLEKIAENAKPR